MAERTAVTQSVQLGVESTSGTAVAANRLLPSLQLTTGIEATFTEIMRTGWKFPTAQVPGKEWTAAKLAAPAIGYDELIYMLSSGLAYAAPAQQGGTTAYLWTHTPDTDGDETVKTYTVEQGSSVRAHKFPYGLLADWSLKGDRDKVEFSGSMIGQVLSDGITMTSSPTVIDQVPILPKHVSIYADDTSGGLGTTKLTRVLRWELTCATRFSPLWVVDAANTSWVAHVDGPVQVTLKLLVEANSTGNALWTTTARAGSKKFLRVEAVSDLNAGTAYPYKATFDVCGAVKEKPAEFSDSDGVYATELTFGAVHDATWGQALTAAVICKRTAL